MSMNVVHSGDTYQIYGNTLKTYNKLPVGTYVINFNKMTGFYLSDHNELTVTESKIYGPTPQKVDKVLNSFSHINRNLGVILSGKKGIGKSLFAKQLAIKAKNYSLPLIIVNTYYPGIADFISSIDQEVIVLFDEFEKTFADYGDVSPQEEMLPLFDGIEGGKKLFVIICNEITRVNEYLLNRPGRFHYHFILGNPTPEEISEYMHDKLEEAYYPVIPKIINFSMSVDLTYDILRAIAFELNVGYSFEETLADLNISKESTPRYDILIQFSDGSVGVVNDEKVDIYSTKRKYLWLESPRGGDDMSAVRIDFIPNEIIINSATGEMYLDPNSVNRYVDEHSFDTDKPEEAARYEVLCNKPIIKATLTKSLQRELMSKYLI